MASLGPDLRLQFVLHLHNNAQEQLFTVPFQDSVFHLPQAFPRERRQGMPAEGDQLVRMSFSKHRLSCLGKEAPVT